LWSYFLRDIGITDSLPPGGDFNIRQTMQHDILPGTMRTDSLERVAENKLNLFEKRKKFLARLEKFVA